MYRKKQVYSETGEVLGVDGLTRVPALTWVEASLGQYGEHKNGEMPIRFHIFAQILINPVESSRPYDSLLLLAWSPTARLPSHKADPRFELFLLPLLVRSSSASSSFIRPTNSCFTSSPHSWRKIQTAVEPLSLLIVAPCLCNCALRGMGKEGGFGIPAIYRAAWYSGSPNLGQTMEDPTRMGRPSAAVMWRALTRDRCATRFPMCAHSLLQTFEMRELYHPDSRIRVFHISTRPFHARLSLLFSNISLSSPRFRTNSLTMDDHCVAGTLLADDPPELHALRPPKLASTTTVNSPPFFPEELKCMSHYKGTSTRTQPGELVENVCASSHSLTGSKEASGAEGPEARARDTAIYDTEAAVDDDDDGDNDDEGTPADSTEPEALVSPLQSPTGSDPATATGALETLARMSARFLTHLFGCADLPKPGTQPQTPLARFIAYVTHRTDYPQCVLFAALVLLQRLKFRCPAAKGPCGHRLFISTFMIASKFLCDDSYSIKAWCEAAQWMYSVPMLKRMERDICRFLGWDVAVNSRILTDFEAFATRNFSEDRPLYPNCPSALVLNQEGAVCTPSQPNATPLPSVHNPGTNYTSQPLASDGNVASDSPSFSYAEDHTHSPQLGRLTYAFATPSRFAT
ncbi:hypothetical protein NMY22_g16655 [Coprinellus aureogranulatus]|nr:hypothetical protein NMY22_g16655 [Coprinellus aureogranulatus]